MTPELTKGTLRKIALGLWITIALSLAVIELPIQTVFGVATGVTLVGYSGVYLDAVVNFFKGKKP